MNWNSIKQMASSILISPNEKAARKAWHSLSRSMEAGSREINLASKSRSARVTSWGAPWAWARAAGYQNGGLPKSLANCHASWPIAEMIACMSLSVSANDVVKLCHQQQRKAIVMTSSSKKIMCMNIQNKAYNKHDERGKIIQFKCTSDAEGPEGVRIVTLWKRMCFLL